MRGVKGKLYRNTITRPARCLRPIWLAPANLKWPGRGQTKVRCTCGDDFNGLSIWQCRLVAPALDCFHGSIDKVCVG